MNADSSLSGCEMSRVDQVVQRGDALFHMATEASNEPNEDAMFVSEDGRFFGVIDGHGGAECSAFLRDNIQQEFGRFLTPTSDLDDLTAVFFGSSVAKARAVPTEESLVKCLAEMERLYALKEGSHRCGACVCVSYVEGDSIVTANVGDCKAVLARSRQDYYTSIPMTEEHNTNNPREVAACRQRAGQDAVRSHPDEGLDAPLRVDAKLLVTRSIGDTELKPTYIHAEPQVTRHRSQRNDFVVLASDGIWDHLSPETVVNQISKFARQHSTKTHNAARHIVDFVIAKVAADSGIGADTLSAMPSQQKHELLDDMTAIIAFLGTKDTKAQSQGAAGDALDDPPPPCKKQKGFH